MGSTVSRASNGDMPGVWVGRGVTVGSVMQPEVGSREARLVLLLRGSLLHPEVGSAVSVTEIRVGVAAQAVKKENNRIKGVSLKRLDMRTSVFSQ